MVHVPEMQAQVGFILVILVANTDIRVVPLNFYHFNWLGSLTRLCEKFKNSVIIATCAFKK